MRVGSQRHAVDVEPEELLLIGTDSGGNSSLDDRGLKISCRIQRLCVAPNEKLVVNVRRAEGVEGETGIASKIGAFG